MLETPPHVPIKEQKFLYSLRFSKSLINHFAILQRTLKYSSTISGQLGGKIPQGHSIKSAENLAGEFAEKYVRSRATFLYKFLELCLEESLDSSTYGLECPC